MSALSTEEVHLATRLDIYERFDEDDYGPTACRWACGCTHRGHGAIVPGWSLCNYHQGHHDAHSQRDTSAASTTWYLAICRDCEPVLPQPFLDRAGRNGWAEAHADATGHSVELVSEQR